MFNKNRKKAVLDFWGLKDHTTGFLQRTLQSRPCHWFRFCCFPLPPSRHNTDKEVWATPRPPSRYLSLRSLWAASCPSLEIPVSRRSSLVWSRNKSAARKMSLKCVCCLRALLLKLLYECAPLSGITVRFSSYCFGMLAAPLHALNMRWTCEDQILYLAFFVYLYSLLFSSSFF